MLGLLLDEAKKMAAKPENEVYFAFCAGILDMCLDNPTGNKSVCAVCTKHSAKLSKEHFGKNISLLNLKDFAATDDAESINFEYNSGLELRQLSYRDVPIGYCTLSSYVHLTRNHDPLIDAESRKYFDGQLNQARRLTDAFYNVLDKIQPDLVCTYNGRFNEVRPVFETAKSRNINFKLFEFVPEGDGSYHKVVFDNAMPHDVKNNWWRVEDSWNDSELKPGENIELGKAFFEKRRAGIAAGDKVYIGSQKKGLLPDDWDANRTNIGIFNSSEDEFVAIGGEYVDLSLYPSQLDGLLDLFEHFKDDDSKHFYLRIHPNLSKVGYAYHIDLLNLNETYKNVTVIKGSDSISSYDLMEACDSIVVFGSTMGIEAVYWGKPVILLCCALYYYADVCYIPESRLDFFKLIESDLAPKYNESVLKVGLYFHHQHAHFIEEKNNPEGVDFNPVPFKVFGKKIYGFNYQKLFGSVVMAAVWIYLKRFLATILASGKFRVPIKDAAGKV